MSAGPRVLMVTKDAEIGGGPIHVAMLMEGLASRGVRCRLACQPRGAIRERLAAAADSILPVAISRSLDPPSLWASYRAMRALRRFIRTERIDIVHTHGGVAGLWGRLAARACKDVRVVHTLHGIHFLHYPQRARRALYIRLERALSLRTDRVICVSAGDREAGLRERLFHAAQVRVIPNAPDIRAEQSGASDIRAELGIGADGVLVIHVGRLHAEKWQDGLLRAFRIVADAIPEASLLIVGDGERRADLVRLAEREAIAERVHFLGWRADVGSILRAGAVFALPSSWEGMPLVLLEAMAAGVPVVASAIDGVKEVIHEDSLGLLVPPGDVAALAAALLRMLRDESLRVGVIANARAEIAARYSPQMMVSRVGAVYDELTVRGSESPRATSR